MDVQTIEVRRDDLRTARVVTEPAPDLAAGEALLRVERFGLTANNITYGALGDQLGYWRFFAASEDGWGRIPAWGFAEVVASAGAGLPEGRRAFGYLPMASHVVLRPGPAGAHGFTAGPPGRRARLHGGLAPPRRAAQDLQHLQRPRDRPGLRRRAGGGAVAPAS